MIIAFFLGIPSTQMARTPSTRKCCPNTLPVEKVCVLDQEYSGFSTFPITIIIITLFDGFPKRIQEMEKPQHFGDSISRENGKKVNKFRAFSSFQSGSNWFFSSPTRAPWTPMMMMMGPEWFDSPTLYFPGYYPRFGVSVFIIISHSRSKQTKNLLVPCFFCALVNCDFILNNAHTILLGFPKP